MNMAGAVFFEIWPKNVQNKGNCRDAHYTKGATRANSNCSRLVAPAKLLPLQVPRHMCRGGFPTARPRVNALAHR